jgi:hypothetical protein
MEWFLKYLPAPTSRKKFGTIPSYENSARGLTGSSINSCETPKFGPIHLLLLLEIFYYKKESKPERFSIWKESRFLKIGKFKTVSSNCFYYLKNDYYEILKFLCSIAFD